MTHPRSELSPDHPQAIEARLAKLQGVYDDVPAAIRALLPEDYDGALSAADPGKPHTWLDLVDDVADAYDASTSWVVFLVEYFCGLHRHGGRPGPRQSAWLSHLAHRLDARSDAEVKAIRWEAYSRFMRTLGTAPHDVKAADLAARRAATIAIDHLEDGTCTPDDVGQYVRDEMGRAP